MKRPPIRILDLSGSPHEMGVSHGRAFAEDIVRYTDERVALVSGGLWSGGPISRGDVLDIAESTLASHEDHSADLYAEMIGIAEGAGITPAEAVVCGGFTDFVDTVRAVAGGGHPDSVIEDDCTAFIVPDSLADGQGFYAQTWDMHDSATEFVVLLRVQPSDAPSALVFTTTGCLGQIGMNELGVCVGINNLTATDGTPGVMWPSVVREVLTTDSAKAGLAAVLDADLAGGHSYQLFDSEGQGFNVEAMPSVRPVVSLEDRAVVHTNHNLDPAAKAVEGVRAEALQDSSKRRLATAQRLLDRDGLTAQDLMDLTREPDAVCQVATDPYHVESSGATVMRPKTGQFWAVWGLPKDNEYQAIGFP
ncbi:MAG: C45 family peptidase [Acidimicrobiales bacterium]